MDLFGTNGLINPLTLIFCGALFLGGSIFRKLVANEILGMGFSLIGGTALGSLLFILIDNIFNLKFAVIGGLVGLMVGGFGGSFIMPDSESSGSEGSYDMGGNYEE